MMKSGPARHHAVCQHCGLIPATSADHASARDCIVALEREVHRLRECLRHGRFNVMGAPKSTAQPGNDVAAAPHLMQLR